MVWRYGAVLRGFGASPRAIEAAGWSTALAGALFLHRRFTVQSRGDATREVDWVQSAGMLLRQSAREEVRPMDPAFVVYPAEVETVLESLTEIAEAAVFGVPHYDFGEGVAAAVVLAIWM